MLRMRVLWAGAVIFGLAVLCATWPARPPEAQQPAAVVQIDADDIGGVVTSKNGPEAGVWVIAETGELGTRFAKMVVTDDRGRYVIPDLPQASYSVWVRGYGLVDSPKVKAARGQIVNLTAVLAPSAKAAAEYYPAIYWFSMLKIPDKSVFPGTGSDGNGMPSGRRRSGSTRCSSTAAATATSSATRPRARFPRRWGRSRNRSTPGSAACCPDPRPPAWRSSSRA